MRLNILFAERDQIDRDHRGNNMASQSSDDGWPWVIKLRPDTNRKDVRTAINHASQEGKPIVFKIIRGGDDVKEYVADIVDEALELNVSVTFKPESDE